MPPRLCYLSDSARKSGSFPVKVAGEQANCPQCEGCREFRLLIKRERCAPLGPSFIAFICEFTQANIPTHDRDR
jgi:hypothetical protein